MVEEPYFAVKNVIPIIKKQFEVEKYNNMPIYKVQRDGQECYLPYWEASYAFDNIGDCKARMNMKTVGILV